MSSTMITWRFSMELDSKGKIVYVNHPAACLLEVDEGYREEQTRFSLFSDSTYNDSFNEAILAALYDKDVTTKKKGSLYGAIRQEIYGPDVQLLSERSGHGERDACDYPE